MGLTEKIRSAMDMKHLEGEMPVSYLYTAGNAGERFLRGIKEEGKILGAKCKKCGLIQLPPRIYCEQCFVPINEWVELKSEGRVEAFTTSHFDAEGSRLSEPEILAVVRFEGVEGGIIQRIRETGEQGVSIGMAVKAVLRERKNRVGSILDVAYFVPSDSLQSRKFRG